MLVKGVNDKRKDYNVVAVIWVSFLLNCPMLFVVFFLNMYNLYSVRYISFNKQNLTHLDFVPMAFVQLPAHGDYVRTSAEVVP